MDLEQFKVIILPASGKLCRFAFRLLRSKEESEDVVQEVLIKMWDRRSELDKYKNPEAFAMTITKNMCLDILRSRKKFVDVEHEQVKEKNTPLELAERKDVRQNIEKAMHTLPEQQKMIIQLRDVEGYEYEEIADILQISVNTIRVNLSRARSKVREILINTYSYGLEKN